MVKAQEEGRFKALFQATKAIQKMEDTHFHEKFSIRSEMSSHLSAMSLFFCNLSDSSVSLRSSTSLLNAKFDFGADPACWILLFASSACVTDRQVAESHMHAEIYSPSDTSRPDRVAA